MYLGSFKLSRDPSRIAQRRATAVAAMLECIGLVRGARDAFQWRFVDWTHRSKSRPLRTHNHPASPQVSQFASSPREKPSTSCSAASRAAFSPSTRRMFQPAVRGNTPLNTAWLPRTRSRPNPDTRFASEIVASIPERLRSRSRNSGVLSRRRRGLRRHSCRIEAGVRSDNSALEDGT